MTVFGSRAFTAADSITALCRTEQSIAERHNGGFVDLISGKLNLLVSFSVFYTCVMC